MSLTVTRRPFYKFIPISTVLARLWRRQQVHGWRDCHTQSPVAFAISSPTFLGDRPRGPILGAKAEEAPTSPPVARRWLYWQIALDEYSRFWGRCDVHDLDFVGIEFGSCGEPLVSLSSLVRPHGSAVERVTHASCLLSDLGLMGKLVSKDGVEAELDGGKC